MLLWDSWGVFYAQKFDLVSSKRIRFDETCAAGGARRQLADETAHGRPEAGRVSQSCPRLRPRINTVITDAYYSTVPIAILVRFVCVLLCVGASFMLHACMLIVLQRSFT